MNWLKKISRARYLGQCDNLRKCGNEEIWQNMMRQAAPITLQEFVSAVDTSAILDPDESIEEFGADDPETGYYISKWGDKDCYFLYTAGFEFIWVTE